MLVGDAPFDSGFHRLVRGIHPRWQDEVVHLADVGLLPGVVDVREQVPGRNQVLAQGARKIIAQLDAVQLETGHGVGDRRLDRHQDRRAQEASRACDVLVDVAAVRGIDVGTDDHRQVGV